MWFEEPKEEEEEELKAKRNGRLSEKRKRREVIEETLGLVIVFVVFNGTDSVSFRGDFVFILFFYFFLCPDVFSAL